MVLQNTENNARGTLKVAISSSATTIILNTGEGALFPTSSFKVTLKKYEAGILTAQEIINITSRSGDTLTVLSRASEDCPRSETSLVQESTAFDFTAYVDVENGTVIENNITSNMISSIDTALTDRLTIADYIAGTKLYDDSTTGTDAYAITIAWVTSYTQIDWQSFRVKVDVDNTDTATLNINGLWAKNIRKYWGDPLLTGDIVAWQVMEVLWNNYANQFELVSSIDASNAISSDAQVANFSLWYTGTSTEFVAIDVDGKIQKAVVDGTAVSAWFSGTILWYSTKALSPTSFVTLAWSNGWVVQTVIGTISWNVVSYGSVDSITPTSWSSFRGTPSLVVLSSTSYVVSYGYSWFSGGNTEFLQAIAYSVSGTTITRWATNTITNDTTQQTVSWICKVATNKFMISYVATTDTIVACTVSGTTITAGTPVNSLSISWIPIYVSTDKIAITEWANIRLYTFSWTAPTQWNNLAIGTTYTSYSINDIGNSKSIFTGTVSTNTQAFIVDCSWTTPTKGTTVTVLTASTSTDCIKAWDTTVCIITGGNKYYYYTYSGTTLTVLWNETKTNSITINNIDYILYMQFITTTWGTWQLVANLKKVIIGWLKQSGVANDVRPVVMSGILWGFTGLVPWQQYFLNWWGISPTGTVYVGKAKSTTELYIAIPHSTL